MKQKSELLARVSAPHFVAGLTLKDDVCEFAAPILRWAIGKSRRELREYFAGKGWKVEIVQASVSVSSHG